MRVAALQFHVRRGELDANLEQAEAGLRRAAERGIALVCLPEMWPSSFSDASGDELDAIAAADEAAVERVRELTAELSLVACGSAYHRAAGGGLPHNRLHVLDRGRRAIEYDKVHLFSPTAEDESFTAGAEAPPTVDTSAGRLSGAVCYDLRFDETFRGSYRERAEVLVVPAQWPSPGMAHWRALALGRAVASQAFVVAGNRTGDDRVGRRRKLLHFPGNSLVVSPHGEVLAEGVGEEGLVEAEVDLDLVRAVRVRVPVEKDRRQALYRAWDGV